MSPFSEPKIDCHAHARPIRLGPLRQRIFEYKPAGQRNGTPGQWRAQVMKTYGTQYALLVQPNSGYGSDNACLLDTIAHDKDHSQRHRHF